MHDITRISTIFTISNGGLKTPRDNFDFVEFQEALRYGGVLFVISLMNWGAVMIALRASYQFRLATPSYDALTGSLS